MGDVLELIVASVVSRALTYAVVTFDERRLSAERLERAWPVSTLWAAIFQFSLYAIPVHFTRTRRSFVGLLLGLAWAFAVLVVTGVAVAVSDAFCPPVG